MLELHGLRKAYGDQTVLKHVSLTLPKGGKVCIMASSGWGKTTLLRIILGLEKADAGEVCFLNGALTAAVFQ